MLENNQSAITLYIKELGSQGTGEGRVFWGNTRHLLMKDLYQCSKSQQKSVDDPKVSQGSFQEVY